MNFTPMICGALALSTVHVCTVGVIVRLAHHFICLQERKIQDLCQSNQDLFTYNIKLISLCRLESIVGSTVYEAKETDKIV